MHESDPSDATPPAPGRPAEIGLGGVLRRDGWSMLAAAIGTLTVTLGVHAAARWAGVGPRFALMAALAATMLWCALAPPLLAAGGKGAFSALLRGGVVADAAGLALLILWLAQPDGQAYLTFVGAVKIYCTLAAVALAGIAAGRLARRPAGRYAGAVAFAVVVTVLSATPLWITGPARAIGPKTSEPPDTPAAREKRETRRRLVAACVYANPFYSVTAALVEETGFVWHQSGKMYDLSRLFDYAPPPVPWYAASLLLAPLAGILAATHLVRRGGGRMENEE